MPATCRTGIDMRRLASTFGRRQELNVESLAITKKPGRHRLER
jgi:hypothetical protein